jgi:signal peptidase I
VGAGHEVNDKSGEPTGYRVISATCPMCRFTADVSPRNVDGKSYPSYSGDRILVGKFNYSLGSPRRWDVAVFHYPLRARLDYVKRVAGLPNETLRIQDGDVWIKPDGEAEFTIARKPPGKLLAMLQPVFDNDYLLPEPLQKGWPRRWRPMGLPGAAGDWRASEDLKSFHTDGTAGETVWLGYRHVVPRFEDWAYRAGASAAPPAPLKPQLISDFNAYDTEHAWYFGKAGDHPPPPTLPGGLGQLPPPWAHGLNWVGDLVVEFEVNASGASGVVLAELVKGGKQFLCRLDLSQGTAELAIAGADSFQPRSSAGIRGPGGHHVRFANVDSQLRLWIDGHLVKFDASTKYDASLADTRVPDREDLTPVRIGSRGAAVEVSHLRIFRDIYYIAQQAGGEGTNYPELATDFSPSQPGYPYANLTPERIAEFFSSPGEWGVFSQRRRVEFQLGQDEFFMLGDNSAESKDSRLWDGSQFYVERRALVGEAAFVYWPHSLNRIPGTRIPFPMFPNFARMRFVR